MKILFNIFDGGFIVSVIVSLYSKNDKEISRFLDSYDKEISENKNILEWKKNLKILSKLPILLVYL